FQCGRKKTASHPWDRVHTRKSAPGCPTTRRRNRREGGPSRLRPTPPRSEESIPHPWFARRFDGSQLPVAAANPPGHRAAHRQTFPAVPRLAVLRRQKQFPRCRSLRLREADGERPVERSIVAVKLLRVIDRRSATFHPRVSFEFFVQLASANPKLRRYALPLQ